MNFQFYVTGESYAGCYVPYISAAMLDEKDKTYYDLSGRLLPLLAWNYYINTNSRSLQRRICLRSCHRPDPVIGQFLYTQEEVIAVHHVVAKQNNLNLSDTFLATLEGLDESCGYAALREKYLTFPRSLHQAINPPNTLTSSAKPIAISLA